MKHSPKIIILGLGQYPQGSGVAAAEYFARRGARVTVMDFYYSPAMAANARRLEKFKNVNFVFNQHDLKRLKGADLVVKHQRMRLDEPEIVEATRLGIPLENELSIFLKACPAPVIGVTGTRGKSTTSALIQAILKEDSSRPVWLGGNILVSPLTFLSKVKADDVVVVEMSSWQLEGTGLAGVSPHVAVWTNLMRDHLNVHASMEEYEEAKAQILRHQLPDDIVFLPATRDFNELAKTAPGRVYRVGEKGSAEARLVKATKMRLLGEHNVKNAEFAVAVALELGVPTRTVKKVLRNFEGLPNRLEIIKIKNGVRYVNDTTATTPDATLAAVRALSSTAEKIHLILGGADKSLEFEELGRELKKRRVCLTLFPGTAHDLLADALYRHRAAFTDVADLREAVSHHAQHAKKGDVILLSPGCASFGLFKNEFDRGEQFKSLVKKL